MKRGSRQMCHEGNRSSWRWLGPCLVLVATVVVFMVQSATALASAECGPDGGRTGRRTFLPDCRAYEMVTPPFQGGNPAVGIEGRNIPMSEDASRLLGIDFAGFAETGNVEQNGLQFGAIYLYSRGASGWSAEALEPPASLAARRVFVVGSSDLSRTLWLLTVQAEAGEEVTTPLKYKFAVREAGSSGARFVDVGPADAPGQTTAEELGNEKVLGHTGVGHVSFGASGDLSHLVLGDRAEQNRLWPGDQTQEGYDSLYEYVGTGNQEPRLVGVKNLGELSGARVNEHAELVSECGTTLGSSGRASVYNAVSASGETIYFTADHNEGCPGAQPPVNELYARIAGKQTVDISEPTTGAGGDCSQCDTSVPADATFQGASDDGAKVYFLSAAKLLPGAEGEGLYEYDFDAPQGQRVTLVAPDVPGVARIAQDGSHVYFASRRVLAGSTSPSGTPEDEAYNLYDAKAGADAPSFVANLLTVEDRERIQGEVEQQVGVKAAEERVAELGVAIGEKTNAVNEKESECAAAPTQEDRELCEAELATIRAERETLEAELSEATETVATNPQRVAEGVARRIRNATGIGQVDKERPFETTHDGRYLLLENARPLTGSEDRSTVPQLFEYDAEARSIVRVSIGQRGQYACAATAIVEEGYNCNGNTDDETRAPKMQAPNFALEQRPTESSSGVSLASDGTVFFGSANALTPQSVEGTENLYSYRAGEVALISPGDEAAPLQKFTSSRLLGAGTSGTDVMFLTTDQLVPQDGDSQASWYDAREGGGFPAPISPVGCGGEACQGPPGAPPLLPSRGGSEVAGGEGPSAATEGAPPPGHRPLSRAQKLKKALKACAKKPRRLRRACRRHAEKQFGPLKHKARSKR